MFSPTVRGKKGFAKTHATFMSYGMHYMGQGSPMCPCLMQVLLHQSRMRDCRRLVAQGAAHEKGANTRDFQKLANILALDLCDCHFRDLPDVAVATEQEVRDESIELPGALLEAAVACAVDGRKTACLAQVSGAKMNKTRGRGRTKSDETFAAATQITSCIDPSPHRHSRDSTVVLSCA